MLQQPLRSGSITQAKTHRGDFLDQVQRGPVQVFKRDRVVGVMVSAQDHEAMRNFYANCLQGTLAKKPKDAAPRWTS